MHSNASIMWNWIWSFWSCFCKTAMEQQDFALHTSLLMSNIKNRLIQQVKRTNNKKMASKTKQKKKWNETKALQRDLVIWLFFLTIFKCHISRIFLGICSCCIASAPQHQSLLHIFIRFGLDLFFFALQFTTARHKAMIFWYWFCSSCLQILSFISTYHKFWPLRFVRNLFSIYLWWFFFSSILRICLFLFFFFFQFKRVF